MTDYFHVVGQYVMNVNVNIHKCLAKKMFKLHGIMRQEVIRLG